VRHYRHYPAHAKFGGSSAYRWMKCPGSIKMAEMTPPREPNRYMLEGTAAHELAELCLKNGQDPLEYVGRTLRGVEVTDEMRQCVDVYVKDVFGVAHSTPRMRLEVETRVVLSEDCFGTVDAIVFDPDTDWLYVWDYKHGAGQGVEAQGNQQLLFYATLAMKAHESKNFAGCTAKIVQPRFYGIDSDMAIQSVELDVLDLIENLMAVEKAIALAKADDAPLVTGSHCYWCPAFDACPAAFAYASQIAAAEFVPLESIADEGSKHPLAAPLDYFDAERMGKMLKLAVFCEKWAGNVRQRVRHEAWNRHITPEGCKWIKGNPRTVWSDEADAASVLLEQYGGDFIKPVTPAQARKKLGKAKFQQQLGDLVMVKEAAPMLTTEDNTRRAITPDFDQHLNDFEDFTHGENQ